MTDNLRKLVTIRTIDALDPIEGADLIEVATVEGWKLVVKKGEFKVGDPCIYCEIDSFLPDGNPAWQFLVDKSSRVFEGVKGHKLRTIKLKGQVSQGLALPLQAVPQVIEHLGLRVAWSPEVSQVLEEEHEIDFHTEVTRAIISMVRNADITAAREIDLSEALGIVKYEAPLPAELAGQAAGLFPSFMQKTDQERCQNLKNEIFGYDDVYVPVNADGMDNAAFSALIEKGIIEPDRGPHGLQYVKKLPAKASRDDRYEITMKMDGSSMTTFHRDGEVGVCSRNLQLKVNDDNSGNTFVRMLIDSGLQQALPLLGNVAIQGELMGPAIQGNRENFKDFRYYVFDIFLIDEGRYATPAERRAMFDRLTDLGVDTSGKVFHVPVLHEAVTLQEIGITSIEDLLKMAEGPSLVHAIREGLVFKRVDGQFSFKAISNLFLAKEKD